MINFSAINKALESPALEEAKKQTDKKTTALSKQAIVNTALANRMPSAGGDSLAIPSQSGWGASN